MTYCWVIEMNKTIEALLARIEKLEAANKLAEEALESAPIEYDFHGNPMDEDYGKLSNKALAAIREALAEPVKQEPVGEVVLERMGVGDAQIVRFQMYGKIPPVGTKLYAAPVRTKDLTDDEIEAVWIKTINSGTITVSRSFARAVITAFKEKNK